MSWFPANSIYVPNFITHVALYSLSSHKWGWEEDMIRARTISDGVAELLTRRLLRLPKSVLSALRVISIFGSEVSMQVLTHVRDVCENSDIIAQLDKAIKEGLIQKTADTCGFVHDMIQQSVCDSMKSDERTSMLKEISGTLFDRTAENRSDAMVFILVDLINRLGPGGASTADRMHYANLNLIAGEKV